MAHGDRRADARRETARSHDADRVLAVEQLGVLAHRQLAVDGEADAPPRRAVFEMTEDAGGAGEILLLTAALADREAEVGFGGVDFGGHVVTVKRTARFEPQRSESAEADRFPFFHHAAPIGAGGK